MKSRKRLYLLMAILAIGVGLDPLVFLLMGLPFEILEEKGNFFIDQYYLEYKFLHPHHIWWNCIIGRMGSVQQKVTIQKHSNPPASWESLCSVSPGKCFGRYLYWFFCNGRSHHLYGICKLRDYMVLHYSKGISRYKGKRCHRT